jgi:hypothetical protein
LLLGWDLFKYKSDVLNALLIVSLAALAVVQAYGLLAPKVGVPEAQAQTPRTFEPLPEVRPEPPLPRTSGRSAIRVARAHTLETD